jgi:hypothetical protein
LFCFRFLVLTTVAANRLSITQRIWAAFITEHVLLLIKIGLAYLVPDTPAYIQREMAKKAWIRERQIAALEKVAEEGAADIARARQEARAAAMRVTVQDDRELEGGEEFQDEV